VVTRFFVILALALGAVGAQLGPVISAEYVVVIKDMAFLAPPAGLHVGDTIVWRNEDIFRHTATARDESFDVDLEPGAEAKIELKTAGAIAFFCRFHPGMTGTLAVAQ
jgi:plastocyanin